MSQLTLENIDQLLKDRLDTGFEDQAKLINNAFQEQKDHFDLLLADLKKNMDERFDKVDERFDKVEGRLQTVETKLDRALYTELVHLESRLRRVEEKVGIKPQTAK